MTKTTEQAAKKLPIAQLLSLCAGEIGAVKKEGWNQANRYNFRGIDGVMNAVHPVFTKYGVQMQPETLSLERSTAQTNNGKLVNVCVVQYKLTFHGVMGDTMSVVTYGEANDYGDKAVAKAHSVALRTALLQTLCLPTEDRDPDQDSYEHVAAPTTPAPAQQGQPQQPLQPIVTNDMIEKIRSINTLDELRAHWQEAEKAGLLTPELKRLFSEHAGKLPAPTPAQGVNDAAA